jgi:hypothetical protein
MNMATERTRPVETLDVADILNVLGIDCSDHAEESKPYYVIPGNYGPRWLIPAGSRAAAAVLGIWHPYNLSSRMKWYAVRMAARAGVLRLIPAVSKVNTSRIGALRWYELCGVRSPAGEMVIFAGNPSPHRKLAVFMLDDARHIAAVCKVGLTPSGGQCVLHEAEVLRKLEPYRWAPKLLSVYPELHAAAQAFVPGEMPGRGFRPEYMDLLCRLPMSGESTSLANVAGELARKLGPYKERIDQLAPGLLERSLGNLDCVATVRGILAHGDFAPWNMRKNPEAGYVLVDWEWADFAGLPAYDLLHFHFCCDFLFGKKAAGYLLNNSRKRYAEYFRRMDIDMELLPRLAVAYLLDQLRPGNYRGLGHQKHIEYLILQLNSINASLGRK